MNQVNFPTHGAFLWNALDVRCVFYLRIVPIGTNLDKLVFPTHEAFLWNTDIFVLNMPPPRCFAGTSWGVAIKKAC